MTMKRRDAIKALGALAGAATTTKLLAACGDNDGPGSIDTYVYLMMENRSYDHYLGARSMLEGLPGNGLQMSMSNPDLEGNEVAVWAAGAAPEMMCVPDPPHSWSASRQQLADGTNSGFLQAYQSRHGLGALGALGYMTRERVPVTNAIADAHTSCDRWFSSVLGPTLPNRMYWHAGTANGATNNDDVLAGAFQGIPSIHHRMNDAGIDWAYYYGDVPVLGVLEDIDLSGRLRRFLYDFIDEAAAGTLPTVCYIDPGFGSNDDHPPHHPLLGQMLISTVYTALATSPHWNNCMLVITYDEHGGFFDHVAPPTAPDDMPEAGFDQLGFRVPTVVAGPYVKQGYVSSVQYDHTSALKHLETVLGTEPLTARSSGANDLADCIDLERLAAGRPARPATMPAVEIDEASLPDACSYDVDFRRGFDHDILEWGYANRSKLGSYYRVGETRDYVYGIAEYLDYHNLGRIRRRPKR